MENVRATMYRQYSICVAWHMALRKIGCMDPSVVEVFDVKSDNGSLIIPLSGTPTLTTTPLFMRVQSAPPWATEITYDVANTWRKSFKRMIRHPNARQLFKKFVEDQVDADDNNLLLWQAIEAFRTMKCTPDELEQVGDEIHKQFFNESTTKRIDVDDDCRQTLNALFSTSSGQVTAKTFDKAQKQVHKFMKNNYYQKFVDSNDYKDFIAELIPLKIMQSWSTSYFTMMKYDEARKLFAEFLTGEHAVENLSFWEAVQRYRISNKESKRQRVAEEIFNQYVSDEAESEISVDSKLKGEIKKKYKSGDAEIFDQAGSQAYLLLKRDYFARFGSSPEYKTYIEQQISFFKMPQKHKIPLSVIKGWTADFDDLMKYELARQALWEFLSLDHSDENIRFWESVQVYKTIDDMQHRKIRAREIFKEFVSPDADTEVNIDDKSRQVVKEKHTKGDLDAFQAAIDHVYNLMKRDSHVKFSNSDYFKKFVEEQAEAQKFVTPMRVMKSWKTDFDSLMANDYGRHVLTRYLTEEHSEENIRFWEAVKTYKNTDDEKKRKTMAKQIYNEFMSPDAEHEINVDGKSRKAAESRLEEAHPNIFDAAEMHIYMLMKRDSFPKLIRSNVFKDFNESLKNLKPLLPPTIINGWSSHFEDLVDHEYGKQLYFDFLHEEHADELLQFYDVVQSYNRTEEVSRRKRKAREIFGNYIASNAPHEIAIESSTRADIKRLFHMGPANLFEEAEKEIISVMKRDFYPRFLHSKIFTTFVEENNAKLEGKTN